MGPKRRLSPGNTEPVITTKRPRPVKTTTEEEFYAAAQKAANRPPTKAELQKIECVRQERLRRRGEDKETAAADTQSSINTSYSSDDLYADAMAATPTTSEDSPADFPPNQEMGARELEGDNEQNDTIIEVPPTRPDDNNSDLKEFLANKFDQLASKQDFQIVITDIKEARHNVTKIQTRVHTNTENIALLQTAIKRHDKREPVTQPAILDRSQRSIPSSGGHRLGMGLITPTLATGATCEAQDAVRRSKYEESLRSIRIWPIQGDSQSEMREVLEDFLLHCLLLTQTEVGILGIERVSRLRNQPGQRVHDELWVVFSKRSSREHIASKGRMLASYVDDENHTTAGIRMDVPDFLASDYKTLDHYGLRMRNTHGKTTKRYIKYDEPNTSLLLELRLPGDITWMKITQTLARELVGAANQEEIYRNRKKLTARRTLPPTSERVQPSLQLANYVPVNPARGFGRVADSSDSDSSIRNEFDIHTTPVVRIDNGYLSASGSDDQWRPGVKFTVSRPLPVTLSNNKHFAAHPARKHRQQSCIKHGCQEQDRRSRHHIGQKLGQDRHAVEVEHHPITINNQL